MYIYMGQHSVSKGTWVMGRDHTKLLSQALPVGGQPSAHFNGRAFQNSDLPWIQTKPLRENNPWPLEKFYAASCRQDAK